MKFATWNVNGINSLDKNKFFSDLKRMKADVLCLQNVKNKIDINLQGYEQYWNISSKEEVGTAVFINENPKNVIYKMGNNDIDQDRRVTTIDFGLIYIVNCFSSLSVTDKEYRQKWFLSIRDYLLKLESEKPVIICIDFGDTGEDEIDLIKSRFLDTYSFYNTSKESESNCILTSKSLKKWLLGSKVEENLNTKQNCAVSMDIM